MTATAQRFSDSMTGMNVSRAAGLEGEALEPYIKEMVAALEASFNAGDLFWIEGTDERLTTAQDLLTAVLDGKPIEIEPLM